MNRILKRASWLGLIKEGVRISAAKAVAAEAGRKFTNRQLPHERGAMKRSLG
jgi:hypothetical protein